MKRGNQAGEKGMREWKERDWALCKFEREREKEREREEKRESGKIEEKR